MLPNTGCSLLAKDASGRTRGREPRRLLVAAVLRYAKPGFVETLVYYRDLCDEPMRRINGDH